MTNGTDVPQSPLLNILTVDVVELGPREETKSP